MVPHVRWTLGFLGGLLLLSCHRSPPGGVTPSRAAEADKAARQAIANEQAIDVASLTPASLGVPPFQLNVADTSLTPLAYGLPDLLITDLARSGRLQLVDRLRLDAVLREIRLVETGRVDTATAPRVGKLIGARRLVLGTLTQATPDNLRIGARVADVATGQVRSAVDASAPLEDILQAEKALAFELFDQLGVNLTPAERSAVEQLPTKNIGALLAYSRGVRFQVEGRFEAAAQEYREAVQLDPGFSAPAARLNDVQPGPPGPEGAPQVQASAGEEQLGRAAGVAVERVNGVFYSPLGGQQTSGPTDPSFPAATVTLIITILTP